MIDLDPATFLLQWATGGLFFMWITGRHRLVGIGYGWSIRLTYLVIGDWTAGGSGTIETVSKRAGSTRPSGDNFLGAVATFSARKRDCSH